MWQHYAAHWFQIHPPSHQQNHHHHHPRFSQNTQYTTTNTITKTSTCTLSCQHHHRHQQQQRKRYPPLHKQAKPGNAHFCIDIIHPAPTHHYHPSHGHYESTYY